MACFMGLLVQLAAKPEVLRVSPVHRASPLSFQGQHSSGEESHHDRDTSLVDAGLDGAGEVIQVSCVCVCVKRLMCAYGVIPFHSVEP